MRHAPFMETHHLYGASKAPLTHEVLTEVIDLALWVGQLLLQSGAETQRIEETVHRIGTGLGCDWMDVYVHFTGLMVTASSGTEFRTKVRRVVRVHINNTVLTEINDLSRRVSANEVDIAACREALHHISTSHSQYNRWMVVVMVGLACAAFCRLFGADFTAVGVTFVASSAAMFTRQELTKRHFNNYVIVSATAFVGALLAALLTRYIITTPNAIHAIYASTLLLVPGAQLINSFSDMIKGYTMMGIARGTTGAIISLAIAFGLIAVLWLVGFAV